MVLNKILQEIQTRKEVYKKSPSDMVSAYERETETEKEYNGRQLLELLQNADDEQASKVLIELDTKKNLLTISNSGDSCTPFSYEGIRSLMISNLSSKTTKKSIGNKGLGFRSIINWSEKITINSAGLDIIFSREIVDKIFDELFDVDAQQKIRKDRNLPPSIKPIPFLSIPAIVENIQNEWTTSIQIHYKPIFEDDIHKQLKELKNEILLFLNNIENLVVIVDDEIVLDVNKPELFQQWTIYQRSEKLPKELWDEENEEEYFNLKIALQDNLHNDIEELFAYFPTKIDINLPFIVHGTFELNSSRNDINDSSKNRYILKQLVALIISTAKELTKEKVSYRALEMLAYTTRNRSLESLGFFDEIDEAIENLKVFPCLDGIYRKMDEVVFVNELSRFVKNTDNIELFNTLLIPLTENINLDSYSLETSVDAEKLKSLSISIESIKDRADFIYMFYNTCKHEEELPLLVDKNNKLIGIDDDIYTPSNKDFSIPNYVNIRFIHPELFNRLVSLFEIPTTDKARELQRKLKDITNIQSYEPAPVLQKIVTSTNRELKKDGVKQDSIIKEMVQSLYENYILLDKTDIPSGTKVQLLNKNNTLSDASDLFLSSSYPSGELTQMLFEDIFSNDEFLADINTYNLENEPLDDVELFFLWLGVNQISKLVPATQLEKNNYCHVYFSSIKGKPDYAHHMTIDSVVKKIYKLDEIAQQMSLEKFILWSIKDKHIYDSFNEKVSVTFRGSRGRNINGGYCGTSFVYYQLQSLNLYKDYLIGNEKRNTLVNNSPFNFKYQEFEKYNIHKSDIESMMLKLGAVDKFEKLSIQAVSRIASELPENDPEGKQAQAIYKLCIKHFEYHQKPLVASDDIKLFAKKDEEKRYFNKDEVFYNGNIKLPKKITKTKAILDFPRRQSTTNVIGFFGINNLNEINIDIVKKDVNHALTNKFQKLLEQIKEYILVYRIKDIEADKTAEAELRKLQNLNIILCSTVHYKIDDEIYELDNNDYIKDIHDYLIKIDSNKSLKNIIGDKLGFEFQESFADIIGLVFDIQDTHVFRHMIKEDTAYIEQIIRNDIGSDELIRARELLGKTDEYYSFWKTIYDLKDEEYNLSSDSAMFDVIKKEFNLITPIEKIDYRHLNTFATCKQIEQLFMELNLIVEDFNNKEPFYKIDCFEFHKVNLQQSFDSNSMQFQKILYTYCLQEHKEKEFNDLKALYNQNANYIIQQAEQSRFTMDIDYKKIVQEYIENNFNFEVLEPTTIDFKNIYEENSKKIDLDKLNGNSNYISLLYFADTIDEINSYIQSLEQSSQDSKTDTKQISEPKLIQEVSLVSSYESNAGKDFIQKPRKAYKHSSKSDTKKQKSGEKAELEVFHSLCVKYGKENVEHVSLDDDSLGYDIKYKNEEGIYKYVEVKTFSNGQFYLTKNEKEFAQNNFGFYELFLVSDTILKISDIDYNNESIFTLDSSEYMVRYSIQ